MKQVAGSEGQADIEVLLGPSDVIDGNCLVAAASSTADFDFSIQETDR